MYSRLGLIASFVFASAIAAVACSSSDDNNDDKGGNNQPDGGPGNNNGEGGSPGPVGEDLTTCDGHAKATCKQLQSCTPFLFERSYEDTAHCIAWHTQQCEATPAAERLVLTDPAQCATAMSNCESYLRGDRPAACQLKRGSSNHGKCGTDAHCVAGQYCENYGKDALCKVGECLDYLTQVNPQGEGDICEHGYECPHNDESPGVVCSKKYDAIANGHASDGLKCRPVTLGIKDQECAANTEKQCAAGFSCTSEYKCKPYVGENADCDATHQCDPRFGLSCQAPVKGSGSNTCRPLPFAKIGGQCGKFTDPGADVEVDHVCADLVATCDKGSTPNKCVAKVGKDAACTTTPDNCLSPYTCRGGTCKPADPPTCN